MLRCHHTTLAAGLVLALCAAPVMAGDDPKTPTGRAGAQIGEALPDVAQVAILHSQIESLKAENRDLKTDLRDLKTENRDLRTENRDLKTEVRDLKTESRSLKDNLAATQGALAKATINDAVVAEVLASSGLLQENFQATLDELDTVRKRSAALETERQTLTTQLQQTRVALAAAEKDAKVARDREDMLLKRIEELTAGGRVPLGGPEAKPQPMPAGVRGEVSAYQDGLVVVSIGMDAGVGPKTELDLYRTDRTGAKMLGKVVVTDAYPKYAVGSFKPVSGKPLKQLQPDELPKIGDTVGSKPDR